MGPSFPASAVDTNLSQAVHWMPLSEPLREGPAAKHEPGGCVQSTSE